MRDLDVALDTRIHIRLQSQAPKPLKVLFYFRDIFPRGGVMGVVP